LSAACAFCAPCGFQLRLPLCPFRGRNSANSTSFSLEGLDSLPQRNIARRDTPSYFRFHLGGFAARPALSIMDVSGTIEAILGQKGGEIFSISPDATVYEAIELMANKNVGALLVVHDGQLFGMISERDYTRKIMLHGKRSRETQVREIMSSDLTIVTPREPVENCLRMMTEKRIRHLPVVDGDMLRGVISIGDLVKWVIASQSAAIAHLESYISGGYTG
jgi:CBS domain-containing protein